MTNEAVEFIKNKGGIAHLDVPPRVACCAGSLQEPPAIRIGKPKEDGRRYMQVDVQGIMWYLPASMTGTDEYSITLHKIFGVSRLRLKGWSSF